MARPPKRLFLVTFLREPTKCSGQDYSDLGCSSPFPSRIPPSLLLSDVSLVKEPRLRLLEHPRLTDKPTVHKPDR